MSFLTIPLLPLSGSRCEPVETVRRRRIAEINPGDLSFSWLDRWHPDRQDLEAFISSVFAGHYQATIGSFHEILIGCKNGSGQWTAALGFSALAHRAAFLEQYLDAPIEQVVGAAKPSPDGLAHVGRWEIVEVGNLAALQAGASRALIVKMTEYLHRRHFRWVVFTATKSLVNSFSKLHYQPVELGIADPARLLGDAGRWGSYYQHSPRVMVGDIRAAYGQFFPQDT